MGMPSLRIWSVMSFSVSMTYSGIELKPVFALRTNSPCSFVSTKNMTWDEPHEVDGVHFVAVRLSELLKISGIRLWSKSSYRVLKESISASER